MLRHKVRLQTLLASIALVAATLVPLAVYAKKRFRFRTRGRTLKVIPSGTYTRVNEQRLNAVERLSLVGRAAETIPKLTRTVNGSPITLTNVKRKRFASSRRSRLNVGEVTLASTTAAAFDTGEFVVNGRLLFSGGPARATPGTYVTVHVRVRATPTDAATGGRIVWQSKRLVWLRRGEALTGSLLAVPKTHKKSTRESANEAIKRHFADIDYVEVELIQVRKL